MTSALKQTTEIGHSEDELLPDLSLSHTLSTEFFFSAMHVKCSVVSLDFERNLFIA